jgi:hypothetical protein
MPAQIGVRATVGCKALTWHRLQPVRIFSRLLGERLHVNSATASPVSPSPAIAAALPAAS